MTMAFEHPSPCIADGASQTLALPKRVDPGAAIAVVLPPAKTADPTRTTPPMAVRWVRLVDGHAHFEGMTNIAPGGAAATGEGLALTVRAPDTIGKYKAYLAVAAAAGDPRAPDAIVIESNETHVLPEDGLRYAGGDAERAPTQIGRRQGGIIASNGTPGFLVHGPYAALPAGIYRVVVQGSVVGGTGWADVCHQGGTARLGYHPFGPAGGEPPAKPSPRSWSAATGMSPTSRSGSGRTPARA